MIISKALGVFAATLLTSAASAAASDSTYVKMAGAGDQYEIQSSKLVLTSTKNPAVKRLANMMIQDHMKSSSMVKAAAAKAGMHPKPAMLDPDGKDMLRRLRLAKGQDRDSLYIEQQKMAHTKALSLHQEESAAGATRSLKIVAGKIVPVVQHHKSMIEGMRTR